jgi:hypothetical protein
MYLNSIVPAAVRNLNFLLENEEKINPYNLGFLKVNYKVKAFIHKIWALLRQ